MNSDINHKNDKLVSFIDENGEKSKLSRKEFNKRYYLLNKIILLEKQKEYRNINKESLRKTISNWYLKNPNKKEEYKLKRQNLTKEQLDKNKIYQKEYKSKNKEKYNIKVLPYLKNRRDNDPLYKLSINTRNIIRNSILSKKFIKKSKSEQILSCSILEFKKHIESKFESWMTWENYGKYNGELNYGWDLDHIIPISSAKTQDEIIKLNHYINFQPLCSYTNRHIKSNKIQTKIAKND